MSSNGRSQVSSTTLNLTTSYPDVKRTFPLAKKYAQNLTYKNINLENFLRFSLDWEEEQPLLHTSQCPRLPE